MRLPFALAILLAVQTPIAAQVSPSGPPTAAPAPAADTVAAIHRLFAAKRKVCTFVAGGTALVSGAAAMTALNQPAPNVGGGSFGGPIDGRPIMATFIGVVGAGVVGLELLTFGGWGQRRESRTVAAFQQHQLPQRISRRLKPVYFRL